jgi:myo-inositol-1(or 4)-monophosphatase
MDAPTLAVLDHVRALGARVAAELHAMQHQLSVTAVSKGGVDVVTAADTRSEQLLTEELAKAYPQHRIAGEEGTRIGPADSPWCWHLDPLDGTCNYSRGLPYWMVSIGLSYGNRPVLGCLAGPACGMHLAGGEGLGAWEGDRRLARAEPAGEERTWLVATDWPWDLALRGRVVALLTALAPRIRQFKTYGSAAVDLAHVALGRVDAYAIPKIFPWDQCGGAAICAELGYDLRRWDGSPWNLEHNDIICQKPGMALERFTG